MKKLIPMIIVSLLLTSMFILTFNAQRGRAEPGSIYIRADGSIDPSTANITTIDKITYTFTHNIIFDSIVVERDNIVVDGAGHTLQGTGAGTFINGIYLSGRTNVTIRNTHIEDFDYGILLSYSSYNNVSRNNITTNDCGIELSDSSSNNISENNITNNDYGIDVYHSSSNSINRNDIRANNFGVTLEYSDYNTVNENNVTLSNSYGIWLGDFSNYCSVSRNNISNNFLGILLFSSSRYNDIIENNITANNGYGIMINSCSDNSFYHNNIGNSMQFSVNNASNVWDDGYPSGGNYWSDYNGTDADNDRMGDTPYIIDGNNIDHNPLMNPWTPPDIAVLNLSASKTVIGQGYPLHLNVTIENQGNKIEGLTVDVYLNNSLSYTGNFILTSGNLNFTIVWNATGFSMGNYTVKVAVEPLQGELDLADNNMTKPVFLTIPGDINGDGTVNILDSIIVGNSFLATPSSLNWNPNADINDDNTVNILDSIIVGNHFLQHYP